MRQLEYQGEMDILDIRKSRPTEIWAKWTPGYQGKMEHFNTDIMSKILLIILSSYENRWHILYKTVKITAISKGERRAEKFVGGGCVPQQQAQNVDQM